jgi:ribonuclease-3
VGFVEVSTADLCTRAEQIVGYQFKNPELLLTALTHSSCADSRLQSNERLEFLGDAVLGMVVCEELFHRFQDWLEGDLTKVKSVIVSRKICAQIANSTGLTEFLILGNGIEAHSHLPTSVRAAVLESIIGALYVDGGLEPARRFILRAVSSEIDKCEASEDLNNFKSVLQQFAQRWLSASPHYEILDEQGPDHCKCFEICVAIGGERFPSAWGPSKKQAEQEGARRALEILQRRMGGESGEDAG